MQWRIQDFPDGDTTPDFGVKIYYFEGFAKICMKSERNWTESGGRGHVPSAPPMIRQWNGTIWIFGIFA